MRRSSFCVGIILVTFTAYGWELSPVKPEALDIKKDKAELSGDRHVQDQFINSLADAVKYFDAKFSQGKKGQSGSARLSAALLTSLVDSKFLSDSDKIEDPEIASRIKKLISKQKENKAEAGPKKEEAKDEKTATETGSEKKEAKASDEKQATEEKKPSDDKKSDKAAVDKAGDSEVTIGDIRKALPGLNAEDKEQLTSLMLVYMEKKNSPKDQNVLSAAKKVLNDFVSQLEKAGATESELSALKGLLKNEKLSLDDAIGGVTGATNLATEDFQDQLGTVLEPIYRQFYQALANQMANPLSQFPGFSELRNDLRTPRGAAPKLDFADSFTIPNTSGVQGNHRNFAGRSGSGGARGSRGSRRGITAPGSSFNTQPDPVKASSKMDACVKEIRNQKRFNVELSLPGAMCASTPVAPSEKSGPVAKLNAETLKQLYKEKGIVDGKVTGKSCPVTLSLASHCLEGISDWSNQVIGATVGNEVVNSIVITAHPVDSLTGAPVENGNPDLAFMLVAMPCDKAARLNIAEVPSGDSLEALTSKAEGETNFSQPIVMQQNTMINAGEGGNNHGTIVGEIQGFDRFYARFNTNVPELNRSSNQDIGNSWGGIPIGATKSTNLDSSRIKSGDSGGTALTCSFKKDGSFEKIHYLGAISHIDARGDRFLGQTGGVASGESLKKLSAEVSAAWNKMVKPSQEVASVEIPRTPAVKEVASNVTHEEKSPVSLLR